MKLVLRRPYRSRCRGHGMLGSIPSSWVVCTSTGAAGGCSGIGSSSGCSTDAYNDVMGSGFRSVGFGKSLYFNVESTEDHVFVDFDLCGGVLHYGGWFIGSAFEFGLIRAYMSFFGYTALISFKNFKN